MPPIRSVPVSTKPVAAAPKDVPAPRLMTMAIKLIAFGFAGAIGFGVDILGTLSLINFGLGPLVARALAITAALVATYAINRGVTFRKEASSGGKAIAAERARYVLVALATSALNWMVYALALMIVPGLSPVLAVVLGSATAMVVSYVGYARFAFRG